MSASHSCKFIAYFAGRAKFYVFQLLLSKREKGSKIQSPSPFLGY